MKRLNIIDWMYLLGVVLLNIGICLFLFAKFYEFTPKDKDFKHPKGSGFLELKKVSHELSSNHFKLKTPVEEKKCQ